MGFSVLARNTRNILFLWFAILTALISAWGLTFFLDEIWPDFGFYRLHLICNVLIAPACLLFIRVMVRMRDPLSLRLLQLSAGLGGLLVLAVALGWDRFPMIRQLVYFSPGLVVIQTFHLMWLERNLKSAHPKSNLGPIGRSPVVGLGKRNFIYLGGLGVLAFSVMDHVPWMGIILPSFGNLALIAYVFFLSQAIAQQRLLNLSALLSRFLVLLVVALTLTILYSLLVAWIKNSPGLFFLNSFIASFLILMLLDPLRAMVSFFTQRLLTQKNRKLQWTLEEASRVLTGIVDLSSLFQAVLATVQMVLEPKWLALFVLTGDGTKFRRVRVLGREPDFEEGGSRISPLKEILVDHPLLEYCRTQARKGKFPGVLDQILENEIDRTASRNQRQVFTELNCGLRALGANLLIPLYSSGKVLGFVVMVVPEPPAAWANNWSLLPTLYSYFEQAARTLQSMEVYRKLREKERLAALGQMAAGLAHEIRNPLGAIKGAAQFLDPSLDRPESRFLRVIVEEVDRLNRVVTQFLDYSKSSQVPRDWVDLNQLVEKTVVLMKQGLDADVTLEVEPSKGDVRVQGSAEQMKQVLINLIQNALGAVRSREQKLIRVGVQLQRNDGNREVVLSVEDTGHGIKKEDLDKVFIPFFTTSPQGTGLGLSISHKIVEAHSGRIEILSEEGRFTRVSVVLPGFAL